MNLCGEDRSVQYAAGRIDGLGIRSFAKDNFMYVIAPIVILSTAANALAGIAKVNPASVAPIGIGTAPIVERAVVLESTTEELSTDIRDPANSGGVLKKLRVVCSSMVALSMPECARAWGVASKFAGQNAKPLEGSDQTGVQIAQVERLNLAS